MTAARANWVDPAELAAARAEDPSLLDDRWCHGCGLRPDRSPLAGGCDCPEPRGLCASIGERWGWADTGATVTVIDIPASAFEAQ
jgi:hypothetical protein